MTISKPSHASTGWDTNVNAAIDVINALAPTVVAAPTGVTATDNAAVATAVSAAGSGGVVVFQPGSYTVDQLVPATGQTWVSNGTKLQRPTASSNEVISASGLTDFTLRGFILDGARATSGATFQPIVSLVNTTRTRIIDCQFQNAPSGTAGLILQGSTDGLITQSRFFTLGYGVLVCCTIGDGYTCSDNVISENLFRSIDFNAAFCTENAGSVSAATTIASGSNGASLPQSTINVASTSGFPTSGRVRLRGRGGPVIAYTGVTGTAFTGCTVISGSGTLATGQAVQIAVRGLVTGTVFANNTINGYGDTGIESGTGAVGTTITGNIIIGSGTDLSNSILFTDARDCSATGNTCANNFKAANFGGYGVAFFHINAECSGVSLVNNNIYGNFIGIETGADSNANYDVSVAGGRIYNNSDGGVFFQRLSGYSITGVDFSGNGLGVLIGSSGSNSTVDGAVTGCRIMNNIGAGLAFQQASTGTVVGNRIGDNQTTKTQTDGIQIGDSTVVVDIWDNDLSGNSSSAINNYGASTTSRIGRNRGYNPVGMSSVSPGVSPWTYTAGVTPEVLYVFSGTVSAVSKGSQSMPTSGAFALEPGDTITVTYSVAPTVRADKK